MALFVTITLLFVLIVALAPHNDVKMRGFTACTYDMADKINEAGMSRSLSGVMVSVGRGYLCYARVIKQGAERWANGEQPAIWSNYLFKPEVYDVAPDESEPLSEELLKANLLDDEKEAMVWQENISKENIDESK